MNFALVAALALATAADVKPNTRVDRDTVPLSSSIAVTLSLEGPAPLRIEPPSSWLTAESAEIWHVSRVEPSQVRVLPDGRERWSIVLHVDPFVPGEAVPLQFAPAKVTAGADVEPRPVPWDGLEIRVVTALAGPEVEPRNATGIETLPDVPLPTDSHPNRVIVAFAVLVTAGVMLLLARRLHRRESEPPHVELFRELDRLEGDSTPQAFERLSHALRTFLERQANIPATRLTTAELVVQAERAEGWLGQNASEVRFVLEQCDRVKFAREPATVDDCRRLIERTRVLVEVSLTTHAPA
jgi:hypothetical protein